MSSRNRQMAFPIEDKAGLRVAGKQFSMSLFLFVISYIYNRSKICCLHVVLNNQKTAQRKLRCQKWARIAIFRGQTRRTYILKRYRSDDEFILWLGLTLYHVANTAQLERGPADSVAWHSSVYSTVKKFSLSRMKVLSELKICLLPGPEAFS